MNKRTTLKAVAAAALFACAGAAMSAPGTIKIANIVAILLVSVVLVLIGRFGRGLKDSAR